MTLLKSTLWLACLAVLGTSIALGDDPHQVLPTTNPSSDQSIAGTETLVFLRHGEKPAKEIGQLTPQGLNRALALVKLLPEKYGKPDYLFAPDPAATLIKDREGKTFDYIRPLATIEPLAIQLEMPVQTNFGFGQIDKLDAELSLPKYANATIFIAWEHNMEEKAIANLMTQFGGNPKEIPHWKGSDFDSLYVLRITRTAGQTPSIKFTHDQEGLDHLSTQMPTAAR